MSECRHEWFKHDKTDNMEQCHNCGLWRDADLEIYKLRGNLREVLANERALLKLHKVRDQDVFVFTARLKALCDEFDGRVSTAAAIGALDIVKFEIIAEALAGESGGTGQ